MDIKIITLMLLAIILIGPASAYTFCENGEQGSVDIISLTNILDDNVKEWEWESEQDIKIIVGVKNNLNTSQNITTEIIFLDGDKSVHIVDSSADLKETSRIRGEDDKEITFSFEVDEDVRLSNYNMVIKSYVSDNESGQCHQLERGIKTNSFDYCSDNVNLTIESITDSNDWSWKFNEEQNIEVKIKSLLPKDEYEIELIFYDKYLSEYDVTSSQEDLIKAQTFANETILVNFQFTTEAIMDNGKYGLYVRVTSGDACAEKKIYTNYKKFSKILQHYDIISITDEVGIIVKNITGPDSFLANNNIKYNVELRNTGEKQSQVRVSIYNHAHSVKAQGIIYNFEKDTTRSIDLFFIPSGRPGLFFLEASAEYEYKNDSEHYFEITTESHSIKKKVTLLNGPLEVIPEKIEVNQTIPIEENGNKSTDEVIQVEQEQESPVKIVVISIIVLLLLIFLIIGGFMVYNKFIKDKFFF